MRCASILILGFCVLAAPAAAEEARGLDVILEDFKSEASQIRLEAIQAAADLSDPKLVRPLTKLLKDDEDDVRFAAIEALGKRTVVADQKKAAAALIARVPRKGGVTYAKERLAIIQALHVLARPETVKPLIDGVERETELDESRARLMAVGNVPHADAIDRLVQFLAGGRKRGDMGKQRAFASQALQYATGVKFGRDPDKWRGWWKDAKKHFDFDRAKQEREAAAQAEQEKREKRAERRKGGKKGGRKGRGKKKDDTPKEDA